MRRVQNAALFALQRPELASAIYDSNVWKQRYCSDNADGKNHRCALEFASFYRNHNPSETNSKGDGGVEVKRLNREQRYNRRQDHRSGPARLKRQLPNQGEDEDDTHHAEAETVVLRSEEHTSELQSRGHLVCRLLLEKKKKKPQETYSHR